MDNSKISKIAFVVGILALAVSLLVLILNFTGNKSNNQDTSNKEKPKNEVVLDSVSGNGMAYVDLDTLLLEYNFSIKLQEDMLTEQAKAKANLEASYRSFEKKYNDFMEKARLGSFISEASMNSQQEALVQEQNALAQYENQLAEEYMQKQTELNTQLFDSVMNYISEAYAGKYILILGNAAGSNILYAEPGMNITEEVVSGLNARYKD